MTFLRYPIFWRKHWIFEIKEVSNYAKCQKVKSDNFLNVVFDLSSKLGCFYLSLVHSDFYHFLCAYFFACFRVYFPLSSGEMLFHKIVYVGFV